MSEHELKCWPAFFGDIIEGRKTFEVRKDDRGGFAAGDVLWLREFAPVPFGHGYTGREGRVLVTYVTRLPIPLHEYVGMSVEVIR